MSRRERCEVAGCRRYSRVGERRCTAHRDDLRAPVREPSAFSKALDAGYYRGLIADLETDIQEAAAATGVETEIGILRLVMARLLAEETDPGKLSSGVAKLAGVIISAQRAQRALSGASADSLTDAVATILEELQT